jgi:hypothetical protein
VIGIDRPSIDADRVLEAAMLEALLPALMAMSAERLQFAIPEFDWIVVVWLDMTGGVGCNDLAICQAHCTKRFALQLKLRWAQPTLGSAIGTRHHVLVVERRPPIAFAQGRLRSFPIQNSLNRSGAKC